MTFRDLGEDAIEERRFELRIWQFEHFASTASMAARCDHAATVWEIARTDRIGVGLR